MAEKGNAHWAKQMYFYVVLGVTTIAMATSLYTFVEVNMTKFIFDDLHESRQNHSMYPGSDSSSLSWDGSEDEDEDEDEADLYYQDAMIGSILVFAVAAGALYLNMRFVNPGDTVDVPKKK